MGPLIKYFNALSHDFFLYLNSTQQTFFYLFVCVEVYTMHAQCVRKMTMCPQQANLLWTQCLFIMYASLIIKDTLKPRVVTFQGLFQTVQQQMSAFPSL